MKVVHDAHEYEVHVPYDAVVAYTAADRDLPEKATPEERIALKVAKMQALGDLIQPHITARDGRPIAEAERKFDFDLVQAVLEGLLPSLPFSSKTATAPAPNSSSSAPPDGTAGPSEPPTPTMSEA